MPSDPQPLLAPDDLDRLRRALAGYTVDAVHEALGLSGQAAHSRADLAGVTRALRRGPRGSALRTFVELFLLGHEVDEAAARAAFDPLPLAAAAQAGLVLVSSGSVRATVEIRPYTETGPDLWGPSSGDPWWVVSDLGSDVRPGPLSRDHVLGIGAASLTLAGATPRARVGSALDVGTGCGVQALHLAEHSTRVTATDVSPRALALAATTAALSGQEWDLREGSLLEPVAGEQYDLVVANPPFVVSAGGGDGYDYRDSGLAGDGVCEALLRGLPDHLSPDGTAVLLANWVIPRDGDWQDRVTAWLTGRGCDAWIWQREIADPGEYVSMWLRDAGETPSSARWATRYDAWADWFDRSGVAAVGMGLVALKRHGGGGGTPEVLVAEDVPQAVEQPVGAEIAAWFPRRRRLADSSDATLLTTRFATAPDLVHTRDALHEASGWQDVRAVVRQSHGLRWELEVDDAIAALLAGCDGSTPLALGLAVLAASVGYPVEDVTAAALPVVRDLIGRGFLLPADLS